METHLNRVLEETISKPNVTGCLFADHQGLCLGARGNAPLESAGIVTAIADQASKLEPYSGAPVIITLENDSRMCIVHRNGTTTGAIYKNKHDD